MTKRRVFVIGVRRWAIVATTMIAAGAGMGVAAGTWRPLPKTPPPKVEFKFITVTPPVPAPCADDAILMYGEFYKRCDSRARLEIYPGQSLWTLYKCVCEKESPPPAGGHECKIPCKKKDEGGWLCGPPLSTAEVGCTSFKYEAL